MEEILNQTSLVAAEATYELDPCERLERWWDSVTDYHTKKKNQKKYSGKFLGKFWVNWVKKEPNK